MSRSPVTVRCATVEDVPVLRTLWEEILRRGDTAAQIDDVTQVVRTAAEREDRQVVVAEVDGEVAGAVFLEATTLTPLNLERTVLAVSPHVFPSFRRRGVGSALIDAAVRFAESHGIGHVATAASNDSRDANRFMARLALAPQATLRAATTGAVRARLATRPSAARQTSSSRQIDRVLAARRIRRERVPG